MNRISLNFSDLNSLKTEALLKLVIGILHLL